MSPQTAADGCRDRGRQHECGEQPGRTDLVRSRFDGEVAEDGHDHGLREGDGQRRQDEHGTGQPDGAFGRSTVVVAEIETSAEQRGSRTEHENDPHQASPSRNDAPSSGGEYGGYEGMATPDLIRE
ncbi:hypothetical protein ACFOJ6_06285 [Gordonia humi]|uniref:hypothetical protein n=1 Tax=Gordonia humi TaxID=686429 RepID=UPI00360C9AC3